MPLELPRHELQVRKGTILKEYEYAERYDQIEGEAKQREKAAGRDTKNPEKRKARSATSIVADAEKSLKAATTRLTEISTVQVNNLDLVSELRGRAKESSTDLAGYFNDYKLSLENKEGLSKLDIRLFELLELAEQKGGIGHWLEQWNALMRDQVQRTDVSKMADIADSIRAGIEFQMALLEQNFIRDPDLEKTVVEHYVRTHLSSIAFEISRQVSEALKGHFETDSPLNAARNTLKREDPREDKVRAIQGAVQNLSVHKLFEGKGRQDQQVRLKDPASVIASLGKWEKTATDMSELVQTIGGPNYPGKALEKQVATPLMESQMDVMDQIRREAIKVLKEISSGSEYGITSIGQDVTLFQLSEIARTLLEQHRYWATQLMNPDVKTKLLEQVDLSKNILTVIQKQRQDPKNEMNFYEQALTASQDGSLHDMWKTKKKKLLDLVESCGGNEAVKDLEELFSGGLGGHLDKWATRQRNPRDIRGLAWQLIVTLRDYRGGMETILKKHEKSLVGMGNPNSKDISRILTEMMNHTVGAISNAIAQGLDEDIAAGLA